MEHRLLELGHAGRVGAQQSSEQGVERQPGNSMCKDRVVKGRMNLGSTEARDNSRELNTGRGIGKM